MHYLTIILTRSPSGLQFTWSQLFHRNERRNVPRTIAKYNGYMKMRGWLGMALLIAVLLLGLVVAWMLARFALPGNKLVDIGSVFDYPPLAQPYEVHDPVHVFVVNDGDQLIVLDPLNHVPGGYLVRWNSQEGYFIDPSRGTWFDLHGSPVRRSTLYELVERQGLSRYPVTTRGDRILVDISSRGASPVNSP
jgi:hypothetical protein